MDGDLSDLEPVGGLVGRLIERIDPTPDLSSKDVTVIGPVDEASQQ